MFFLQKPQMLGALGALMFGGRAVQGIELDLSDTGKILPFPECRKHVSTNTFPAL